MASALIGIVLFSQDVPRQQEIPERGDLIDVQVIHSGHVGDYVTWLTLGAGVLAALLALAVR